jgi:predicted amidohydrolase
LSREEGFSTYPVAEISILDTGFGVKFGIFTCFELVLEKPTIQLVKEWGVTDILFPTAWFSELPFLRGKLAWTDVTCVS